MTHRPPTRDDAPEIVALVCACDTEEYGAPDYDEGALLEEWSEPGVDLERDGFVLPGQDGSIAAYGLLLGGDARAWVHPQARGRGHGTRLAGLLEDRARERGTAALAQQVAAANPAARALLEGRGYALTRAYAHLTLPTERAAALPEPAGVRPYDPATDAENAQAVIAARFGAAGFRFDGLDAVLAREPDTSLWFVADDGRSGAIRAEVRDGDQGWISEVAVAEAAAGRGLGAALVTAAARALAARGARSVGLSVRSTNEGALRLYRRLGFEGDWDVEEFTKQL
jgi:ribosomal protein S18 acetylase RimI-like enzyme